MTSVEIDERVNTQGMCFFITSDSPDTNPPYVSGHRPFNNQNNVAVDTLISLHIPETLRTETVVNAIQLIREDTGAAVPFRQRLSHTGTITLRMEDNLPDDVTFRVDIAGVQDYMGNTMTPYSFRFSTGAQLGNPTPTAVPPTATPTAQATATPVGTNTPTATLPPGVTPSPTPTNTPAPNATNTPLPTAVPNNTPTPTATSTSMPSPTAVPTQVLLNEWVDCAQENEVCSVPFETAVRFGAADLYQYRGNVSGPVDCTIAQFGDPLPGTPKACQYWSGSAAPSYTGIPFYPNQSSQISCQDEAVTNNIWVVNPDNHSLTVIDTFLEPGSSFIRVNAQQEIYLDYETPTSVTRIGDYYAVTYRDDDKVAFHSAETFYPAFAIDTGHGSQPIASIADEAGSSLYVSLFGSGEVLEIDLAGRSIISRIAVGPTPRAMALHGSRLLVTRFISPGTHAEVYDLDIANGLSFERIIPVNKVLVGDDLSHGSGLPNFLSSIVINQEGTEAYVTAVKANIDRGTGPHSSGVALDDDNTIRPMLIQLDLVNNQDANVNPYSPEGTIDFDNAADPAGVTFLADGVHRMVTMQGNNLLIGQNGTQNTFTQLTTGFGPQDMCTTLRGLYVKNFTGRSVSAIDIASYMADGARNPDTFEIPTVGDELLSAEELRGLQIFYHAMIPEMGLEGYISCASCHKDGGQDGQVWDLTNLGEGARNTLSLNGSSGTRFGNLHWSANFDEVQDFERQLEGLNRGTGFLENFTFGDASPLEVTMAGQSADLDALAAYINGLGWDTVKRSPYRTYSGELTAAAQEGQVLFGTLGCASCHAGEAYRDGQMHDVGTITETSGSRLFGELTGIRTPTLIELWESAPYFHDGSAATLDDVLSTGAHQVDLSPDDRAALVEFLLSIDREMYIADE